jgi:hypothetical protein
VGLTRNLGVHQFWYKQLSAKSRSYTICDDQPIAFVFSHLILASKFSMPPITHVVKGNYVTYELTNGVSEVILKVLKTFKLLD